MRQLISFCFYKCAFFKLFLNLLQSLDVFDLHGSSKQNTHLMVKKITKWSKVSSEQLPVTYFLPKNTYSLKVKNLQFWKYIECTEGQEGGGRKGDVPLVPFPEGIKVKIRCLKLKLFKGFKLVLSYSRPKHQCFWIIYGCFMKEY